MSFPPNTPHPWMLAEPREEHGHGLTCRGCGWALATEDGYCVECTPPDGFHDDDEDGWDR